MNFFKLKTCWTNAEMIILKLCIASAYLLVGAFFHSFIRRYYIVLLLLFAITVILAVNLWIKKMSKN